MTYLRSNDRRWKDKYFFAKGELVYGSARPGNVACHWRIKSKYNVFVLSSVRLSLISLSCADKDFNLVALNRLLAEERTQQFLEIYVGESD